MPTCCAATGATIAADTGAEPLKGWEKAANDTWKAVIPNTFFGSFNPYADVLRGDWCHNSGGYRSRTVERMGEGSQRHVEGGDSQHVLRIIQPVCRRAARRLVPQ